MQALRRIRGSAQGESGFTLVELLVVMLILGLLAAIAVTAFISQRGKARDAEAKASVRTAEVAMEVYAQDNDGYGGATAAALSSIERTLPSSGAQAPSIAYPSGAEYRVTVASRNTPNTFSITRNANGTKSLTCTVPATGGCPAGGTWD